METDERVVPAKAPGRKFPRLFRYPSILPGLAGCLGLAVVGACLGERFPLIGGPVFAIVLGMVIGNALKLPAGARPGVSFGSKKGRHQHHAQGAGSSWASCSPRC